MCKIREPCVSPTASVVSRIYYYQSSMKTCLRIKKKTKPSQIGLLPKQYTTYNVSLDFSILLNLQKKTTPKQFPNQCD